MDVSYYRKTLRNHTEQLDAKIIKYNKILDEEMDSLPETVVGEIRLVIGQSKLFINERFKQFSGLIDDCELKRGEKETKLEDLAGFWDMISYQIDDLKVKFGELERLESNQWKPIEVEEKPKTVRKPLQVANGGLKKASTNTNGNVKHHNTVDGSTKLTKKPAVRSNFREFLKNKTKQQEQQQEKKSDCDDDTSDHRLIVNGRHNKSTNGVATTETTTSNQENDENKCRGNDIQIIIVNHNNNNDDESSSSSSSKLKNRHNLNDVNIPSNNRTNGIVNNTGKNNHVEEVAIVQDESEKENKKNHLGGKKFIEFIKE